MTDPAWTDAALDDPHAVGDKARRVERMFAAIARSYDLNNRLHSLGRDQAWRRAAVRAADVQSDDVILDVACGTGDLAMALAGCPASRVVGIDFTVDMLAIAQQKHQAGPERSEGPDQTSIPLTYHAGDALRLPIADQSVDVCSIAFGIRNVAKPQAALDEFHRVLRPGGRAVILEFSFPRNRLHRAMYNFYFFHVMPRTASLIARDRSGAYRYLPRSVNTFLDRDQLVAHLQSSGFVDVTTRPLTAGIAMLYVGHKST